MQREAACVFVIGITDGKVKLPLLKSSKKMLAEALSQVLMLKAAKATAEPPKRLCVIRAGAPLGSWLPGTEQCSSG
jgi:hypothetical protein